MAEEPRDIFGDRIRVGDVVAVAIKSEQMVGPVTEARGAYIDIGSLSMNIRIHKAVIIRRYSGVASHQP